MGNGDQMRNSDLWVVHCITKYSGHYICSTLDVLDGKWKEAGVEHFMYHDYFWGVMGVKLFLRNTGPWRIG